MRRRALLGSTWLLAAPAVQARGVIELVTADHRPYAIAEGPEPGFVLTLAAELFRMVGMQVVFRFLPWPEAEARAMAVPGLAIAPLARTPQREGCFLWAVALFENPNGFGTIHLPPPESLADARDLPQIGVIAGSLHEAYLRERGFANLLPMPGRPEALAALRMRDIAAWFCELPKLRSHLGRTGQFGRPILAQTLWLALNSATSDIPAAQLREAHAALQKDGSLDHLLRPFLGASS